MSAQRNTLATGGEASGSGGSISYSVGQLDYIHASGSGGSVSQGVQQVYRISLNVKCFLEGYYEGSAAMRPVLFNQGVDPNPSSNWTDTLQVALHQPNPPYALVDQYKGVINRQGIIQCAFTQATPGSMYYIVLKHRQALETWSASPVIFSETLYDFSSAATQAYGSNQIQMEPGVFAVFSGDINQDANIDLLDLTDLENDISLFAFGYVGSDINGDGNVDLLDSPVVETNTNNFIFALKP